MYGDKGPPKGYSVPRYDIPVDKRCQACSSTEHWTYECPKRQSSSSTAKKTLPTTVKLSRSQMLKYGIKPKPIHFTPEPTEREVFDAELKELRAILSAEVRQERKGAKAVAAQNASTGDVKIDASVNLPSRKAEPACSETAHVKEERDQDCE